MTAEPEPHHEPPLTNDELRRAIWLKACDMACAGNVQAMRLCLERLDPRGSDGERVGGSLLTWIAAQCEEDEAEDPDGWVVDTALRLPPERAVVVASRIMAGNREGLPPMPAGTDARADSWIKTYGRGVPGAEAEAAPAAAPEAEPEPDAGALVREREEAARVAWAMRSRLDRGAAGHSAEDAERELVKAQARWTEITQQLSEMGRSDRREWAGDEAGGAGRFVEAGELEAVEAAAAEDLDALLSRFEAEDEQEAVG